MFIAMNRFKITRGFEKGFEQVWKERESYLDQVPGFKKFHLLKGPTKDNYTLYASHSSWQNRVAFENWTQSKEFKLAHRQKSAPKGTYLEHPELECFEYVI